MTNEFTLDELEAMAAAAAAWLETPEGKAAMQEAATTTAQTIKDLEAARRMTWIDLNTPMDI